jgi:hypothetical protein
MAEIRVHSPDDPWGGRQPRSTSVVRRGPDRYFLKTRLPSRLNRRKTDDVIAAGVPTLHECFKRVAAPSRTAGVATRAGDSSIMALLR